MASPSAPLPEPPSAQARHVETVDGRRLRAEVAGDGRRVVLVQVGTPNAGVLHRDWVQDAAARGLTLIAYDRPGYGGSSRQPGRTVADCAADVRRLSEVVGFERCAVWGFSGGGPHALACGALLDDLVAAVATIGSPAQFDAPGLDFSTGWPDEAREDHELFLADRAAWELQGEQQRQRGGRETLRIPQRSSATCPAVRSTGNAPRFTGPRADPGDVVLSASRSTASAPARRVDPGRCRQPLRGTAQATHALRRSAARPP